jgi:hypothetical protein
MDNLPIAPFVVLVICGMLCWSWRKAFQWHCEEILFSIHQIPSSRSAGGFGANVSAGGRISIAQAANHQ